MFKELYDILVLLTNNYSRLPDFIKTKFPEYRLVNLRQFLFTAIYVSDDS